MTRENFASTYILFSILQNFSLCVCIYTRYMCGGERTTSNVDLLTYEHFHIPCYHRSPVPQTALHGALDSEPHPSLLISLTTEPFPKVSGINRFPEMSSLKQVTDRPISTKERHNTVYLCFTRKSLPDVVNFEAA